MDAVENQVQSNESSLSQIGDTSSNNGSLVESTKKQTVIVIPSLGPDDEEEEEGQQSRRSAPDKPVLNEDEQINNKAVENEVETDEIDEGLGDMNGDISSDKECENNQENITESQGISIDQVDTTESGQHQDIKDTKQSTQDPDEHKPNPNKETIEDTPLLYNTNEYDADAILRNVDHTMTHSVILDDQAEEELERVMGESHPKVEGGQGCVMCEFCMRQERQPETTLAVDYNLAFNKEQNTQGQRGKTDVYMDDVKFMIDGRGSRGIQPDTKEAVFQQALNLMAERTVSRPASKSSFKPHSVNRESIAIGLRAREGTQTPIVGTKSYPFGFQHPEYFYVHQQKPSPMAPIPAWKGYNGNVYFTPINIQQAQASTQNPPKSPDIERCSPVLQQILKSRSRNTNHLSSASVYSGSTTSQGQRVQSGDSIRSRRAIMSRAKADRSSSMMSVKSNLSKSSTNVGCKNLLVLDKRNVLSSSNDNIENDIVVLSSQESTGSLCVLEPGVYVGSSQRQQPTYKHHHHHQQQQPKKASERIFKGSVLVRKITPKNKRGRPLLSVSGDKFNQVPSPSPLLRTQTQYSQSNQRAVLSPDNMSYHSFTQSYEKLPPLEHLKASLRQIENSPSKESLLQVITPQERMKFEDSMDYKKQPFIKFSPELRHGVKPKEERHQGVK